MRRLGAARPRPGRGPTWSRSSSVARRRRRGAARSGGAPRFPGYAGGVPDTPLYVGIDLGTTNSAAAVFDGERVSVVRNAQGATVTPSVVRLDKQGRATVGTRARRFLEQDPTNTAAEFKRLMGTGKPIDFPAAATARTPEQLSCEILKALRQDIADQLGV